MSKAVHIASGQLNNTVTGRDTMAKFLVLGKNGQVGWELQRALALHGEVLCLGRHDEGGDLSSPEKVATSILKFSPNAVFNAAAYTAVDKAETDNEEAHAKEKLERKNLDFIVLNSLNDKGAGFRVDTNKITIIDRKGSTPYPLKSKKEAAGDIIDKLASLLI